MAEEFNKEEYIESQIMNIIDFCDLSVNDEEKIEIVNNFKKLQDINPGINPNIFKYEIIYDNKDIKYLSLLQSPFFEKLGPQFICDIFEYDYHDDGAVYNTLIHLNDPLISRIIDYLKINNLYSTKSVHLIMNVYEECSSLLNNLINNNYVLTDIEKNNFLLYFNYLEDSKIYKDMVLENINIDVNNLIDLRNFKDKYIEQIYKLFDETTTIYQVKEIICLSLFGIYCKGFNEVYGNNYLLEKLNKRGSIDSFDEATFEIINDIFNYEDSIEEKKQKYRNIVKKHISIINKMSKMRNAINNINEDRVNKLLSNDQFKQSKTHIEDYDGQKIKIIDLNGENFTLLIHGINSDGGQDESGVGKVARELYRDPSIWNGEDHSSTISCSFISDKYQGRAYNRDVAIYYGFNNLPYDEIYLMENQDTKIHWGENKHLQQGIQNKNPNRIIKNTYASEWQIQSCMIYNETGIYRKNKNLKEHNKKLQPSYIVSFYDQPTTNELKHAAYFGIPIVHINEKNMQK